MIPWGTPESVSSVRVTKSRKRTRLKAEVGIQTKQRCTRDNWHSAQALSERWVCEATMLLHCSFFIIIFLHCFVSLSNAKRREEEAGSVPAPSLHLRRTEIGRLRPSVSPVMRWKILCRRSRDEGGKEQRSAVMDRINESSHSVISKLTQGFGGGGGGRGVEGRRTDWRWRWSVEARHTLTPALRKRRKNKSRWILSGRY